MTTDLSEALKAKSPEHKIPADVFASMFPKDANGRDLGPGIPHYDPRNIIILPILKGPNADNFFDSLKPILELHVLRTEIRARERQDGASLHKDEMRDYHQEFEFTERFDKLIYNTFRKIRDMGESAHWDLLMIEPSATYTTAVDAWLISDVRIAFIRNSVTPSRNLAQAKKSSDLTTTTGMHGTFVTLIGHLTHSLRVLEDAQKHMCAIDAAGAMKLIQEVATEVEKTDTTKAD